MAEPAPTAMPAPGRLLGLDWGERRIGVAVSDPEQTVAHPLITLTRRTGKRFPLKQLRPVLDEHAPVGLVVGLPVESSGAEGPAAERARAEGELVSRRTGLPLAFWDERMTTARARRAVRDVGDTPERDPGAVDRIAAAIILQAYLDAGRGAS